jgi:4'-phosphopantetheinyl transferase
MTTLDAYSVIVAKIPDCAVSPALLNAIPLEIATRCTSFRDPIKQLGFILGRLLCWRLLDGRTHFSKWIRTWKVSSRGKPSVPNNKHFSISYSGSFVAVGVGPFLGLDLQQIIPFSFADFQLILSPREISNLAVSEDADRLFAQMWTAKEAVIKAAGTGIREDIASLCESPEGCYTYENAKWKVLRCSGPLGYELAVAVPIEFAWKRVNISNMNERDALNTLLAIKSINLTELHRML